MWSLIFSQITRRLPALVKPVRSCCVPWRSIMASAKPRILVAFDFDHTLIDDNSDIYVKKLAPNGQIPQEIKRLYDVQGWTEYMGAIFKYLHQNKVSATQIQDCVRELQFVEGVTELLDHLKGEQYESVIISDANSVFIDCILKQQGRDEVFSKVFTNPAWFNEDGCLMIKKYHVQDWCNLSTINLCKGHILESHIQDREQQGIHYSTVAYIGDGTNDLCPSLKLRPQDLVFPREGFSLIKKIKELENDTLKAKVIPWRSGIDIMKALENL